MGVWGCGPSMGHPQPPCPTASPSPPLPLPTFPAQLPRTLPTPSLSPFVGLLGAIEKQLPTRASPLADQLSAGRALACYWLSAEAGEKLLYHWLLHAWMVKPVCDRLNRLDGPSDFFVHCFLKNIVLNDITLLNTFNFCSG